LIPISSTSSGAPSLTATVVLGRSAPQVARRFEPLPDISFGERTITSFVHRYGLRVIILPDPRSTVFAYHTWYRVGSRHERAGKTGIAHLFEHMMFKATKTFGDGVFDRSMEERGDQTNAATWLDWTYYHEVLPASKGNLEFVASVEADRMVNLILNDTQLSSEREVVINERRYRVEDDPDGQLSERLWANALDGHPYGWPTIGWMADIEGITVADCEEFYRTYYAPNNATLVVVGAVDSVHVLETIDRCYGHLPSSVLPPQVEPPHPIIPGASRETLSLPLSADRLYLGYIGPGIGHSDAPALEVAVELLLGGDSSRLERRLIDQLELAVSIDGFSPQFRYPGLVEIAATARVPGSSAAIEAELLSEIARLAKYGPTPAEVIKARRQVVSTLYRTSYAANAMAGKFGFYDATLGDVGAFPRAIDALKLVGADDIQRAVSTYLSPDRRATVIGLPNGEAPAVSDAADEDDDDDDHERQGGEA